MKKNFAEKIASTFGYDWVVGNDSLLWPQLQIHSNKRWINCCLTDALSQLVSSYVLALPLISCLPTTFIKNTSFSQKTKIITLWKKTRITHPTFHYMNHEKLKNIWQMLIHVCTTYIVAHGFAVALVENSGTCQPPVFWHFSFFALFWLRSLAFCKSMNHKHLYIRCPFLLSFLLL